MQTFIIGFDDHTTRYIDADNAADAAVKAATQFGKRPIYVELFYDEPLGMS